MSHAKKPDLEKLDKELIGELPDLSVDNNLWSVPVAGIPFKEVAIKDLPLYIVISNVVYSVDLPQKEFLSTEEFEDYLEKYAEEKFDNAQERLRFIKKQKNNALYLDDEIIGEHAWQFNGEVRFKNARLCGFGIIKTQSKQFYMFQTSMGIDLPSQFAAYQALTYGMVDPGFVEIFTSREKRERLKQVIGSEVYPMVLKSLGISRSQ